LDAVAKKKPSLEPLLATARAEMSPEGSLRLLCRDEFQRSQIAANLPVLTEIVLKEVGPVPVSCALGAAPAPAAAPTPAPAPRPAASPASAPAEDAEEVSDGGEDAPMEEEDEGPSSPAPSKPKAPAARADEWSASTAGAVEPAEIAALDPGLKKVLDRFPGKLKKLETL
jgi:hypothetical protein